jgi:hypothetical protein
VAIQKKVEYKYLAMHVNGVVVVAINRIKEIHFISIVNLIKQVGELPPNTYTLNPISLVG